MTRVLTILGLLLLLPYAYAAYFWFVCDDCTTTGHSFLYTLVLLVAAPFLLAGFAVASAISSARAMRNSLSESRPARAAINGGFVWLAIAVAVPTLLVSYKMYDILFPEIEEGRDRLGRICERDGNSTVCRPDPETREAMQNAYNQRKWRQP
ncbi:hypothetical protein [Aurantiacibacter zhengii]|nr:hypothetical protein [Aurantiacibacter zhengii]